MAYRYSDSDYHPVISVQCPLGVQNRINREFGILLNGAILAQERSAPRKPAVYAQAKRF